VKNLFLGVCLLLCSGAPVYAATIDVIVDPPADPMAIMQGEMFTVTVRHTNFPQSGGGTLGILWNASVLDLNTISLAPGAFAGLDPSAPSQAQQDAGSIQLFSIFGDLFDPSTDPMGNFDSFIIKFTAVAPGSGDIIIDESGPTRGWNRSDASIIDGIVYNQASVTVSAIPVPAAVWLFGSALGLLGWVRQRAA